jgi:hypothetical protein
MLVKHDELQARIASVGEKLFFLDVTDPDQQYKREVLTESLESMMEEEEDLNIAIKGIPPSSDDLQLSSFLGEEGVVAKRVRELEGK